MGKRAAVLVMMAALAASGSFALDYGGSIANSSGYFTNGTPTFEQSNKLALWFTSQLGRHLAFDIQASGDYQNQTSYGGSFLYPYADLDKLTLAGQFSKIPNGPSLFAFDLGRFLLTDPTGDIYNQSLDGAQLVFAYPAVTVTATVGYTGLTIKPSSTILMSKADVTGLDSSAQYFGSPRAVGLLTIVAPSLFMRQDLTLSAMAQADLRPLFANNLVAAGTTTLSPNEGGPLDTQYFTVELAGPLVSTFFWSGSFTLGTGRMLSYVVNDGMYEYTPVLSFLATGGVRYYRSDLLGLAVGLDATYAGGDADFSTFYEGNTQGNATAFIPVTQSTIAAVFNPQLSNIVTGGLTVSVKPLSGMKDPNLSNLQTSVKVIPFMRPSQGPVSVAGVYNANNQLYLGTEVDGGINYRPFSDLGLALSGGVFFPNAAAFAPAGTPSSYGTQYGGKLEVSFSF